MTAAPVYEARRILPLLLTFVALLLAGLGGAGHLPALPLIVLFVAGLVAAAAVRAPLAALAAGVGVIAMVPVYYGRAAPGTSNLGITPVVVVSLVLLPLALLAAGRVRLTKLDVAVAVFLLFRGLSLLLNFSSGAPAAVGVVLTVALPYAVFRLLFLIPDSFRLVARTLVLVSVPLAVLGILEHRGTPNPLFTLITPGYQAGVLARPDLRLGTARAEASFGHPIWFGMFLALALLLAVSLALTSRQRRSSVAFLAVVPLLVLALVDTLSRGAMLLFVVSLLVWGATQVPALTLRRAGAAVAVAVVLVGVGFAVRDTLSTLQERSTGDTIEANSLAFRLEILRLVSDPNQFSVLGKDARSQGGGISQIVFSRIGVASVDNAYAVLYLGGGAVVLASFTAVGVLTWVIAMRPGLAPVERAAAVGLGVAFVNLLTVNLSTQYADLFWILIAALAALTQGSRGAAKPVPSVASRPVPA